MQDATQYFQKQYRLIWENVSWQPFPFEEKHLMYCTDDAVIRNVLVQLTQVDPSAPSPDAMENATTDLHFVIVSWEDEFVLYWLSYYILEGDQGYVLYRFTNVVDGPFNFQDVGNRFKLPEESTAKIYMDTFTRLNNWANLLQLPYKYEVDLRDNYLGFRKNYDHPIRVPDVADAQIEAKIDSNKRYTNTWTKLWTRIRRIYRDS